MAYQKFHYDKEGTKRLMIWEYSKAHDAWHSGTQQDGCGVFYDNEKWWGNIVIEGEITCYGPYLNQEIAQQTLEKTYKELISQRLEG
jgi:hypothetical protein